MPRHHMPRLTLDEWRQLGRAAEQLTQVAGALRTTNWAGSPLAQSMIRDVYGVVAGLYNRAEPFALAHSSQGGPGSSTPPSAEGGTDPTSEEG